MYVEQKILHKCNNDLDNIKLTDDDDTIKNSRYRSIMQYENVRADWSKPQRIPPIRAAINSRYKSKKNINTCNISKSINLSREHNNKERPVPYRGGSPPPIRSYICNKKMTPKVCSKCERNYLSDLNLPEQRCPYCKTVNDNIEIVIDSSVEDGVFSITQEEEEHAILIQKKWRI